MMEESKEEPRQRHRSWRDRLLLFYGERHLEEKRGSRVAPAPVWAPLATGSRCEVVVAADYIVETTKEGDAPHRGRFSDKMLMSRDQGGFIRGVVIGYNDDGYDIKYADGPYRREDKHAPPPGYPAEERWWVPSNVIIKRTLGDDVVLREVPATLVKEDVLTDDRLPKGVLTLVTI